MYSARPTPPLSEDFRSGRKFRLAICRWMQKTHFVPSQLRCELGQCYLQFVWAWQRTRGATQSEGEEGALAFVW